MRTVVLMVVDANRFREKPRNRFRTQSMLILEFRKKENQNHISCYKNRSSSFIYIPNWFRPLVITRSSEGGTNKLTKVHLVPGAYNEVVTKIDLLPSSISPTSFDHWVITRSSEGGANKLTKVHLVPGAYNEGP
ncbi:hypothetical protein LXL04_013159 [Taraxacum kok-saghyz]